VTKTHVALSVVKSAAILGYWHVCTAADHQRSSEMTASWWRRCIASQWHQNNSYI